MSFQFPPVLRCVLPLGYACHAAPLLRSVALILLSLTGGGVWAQTVPPGFTVSTYVADAQSSGGVTGMTMDAATRTIYYGEQGLTLRKVTPDRSVAVVSSNMVAPSGDNPIYPYIGTDIEYYQGGIYFIASAIGNGGPGYLERVDTSVGVAAVVQTFPGSELECGITIRDGVLYSTDGRGPANALTALNLTSKELVTIAANLPETSSSLEYNAVKDRYYFTDPDGSRIMQATPTGVVSQLGSNTLNAYNLAVEPTGNGVYVISGASVLRYDTSTGVSTTFLSGLTGAGTYPDLVFGPSSSVAGVSLYIGDANRILEVAGFNLVTRSPTVTAPDSITTDEDVVVNFTVTASDPDGDPVSLAATTPGKGTLSKVGTEWTFKPDSNANGTDSFTITASDGKGGLATKTVNLTINPINDAPVFSDAPEALAGSEDVPITFRIATTDFDGDLVTVSFSRPEKGTVSASAAGYTYTPMPDANGVDSFNITATDGHGGTTVKAVNVTVAAVNDVPFFTSIPVTLVTDEEVPVNFDVAAGDVDADVLSFAATNGQKGTVTGIGGNFTYTPTLNTNGGDSFIVTARDANGGSNTAVVQVIVNPVNDAPIFTTIPTMLTTSEDTAVDFSIGAADVDGDEVAITISDMGRGTVSGTAGIYTYTPSPDANGLERLTITASDANGGMTVGVIEIAIAPVNDAPVFTSIPAEVITSKDAPAAFTVSTTDPDEDEVTISSSGAAKGTVTGSAGKYTYTPNPGELGSDRFTVSAEDGQGGKTTKSVKVTIVAKLARYAVLLSDESRARAFLSLGVGLGGSCTGVLRDENQQIVRFRGKIEPDASSTSIKLKGGASLVLQFDSRRRITAKLTTGDRALTGSGEVVIAPDTELQGMYTLAFDPGSGGFGWCVLVMDSRGNLRIVGKLPDGSPIFAGQEFQISGERDAPLFIFGAGSGSSLLSGLLHFASQSDSDVSGVVNFRNGAVDGACDVIGAHFARTRSALPPGSYALVIEGSGVSQQSSVAMSSNNTAAVLDAAITLIPGGGIWRPANGLFKVKFRDATGAAGQPLTAPILGTGVFVQKIGKGFGQFRKDGATGAIRIGE
jgi:VCBS repeat-containing protein